METSNYQTNSYGLVRKALYASVIGLYSLSSGCATAPRKSKSNTTVTMTLEDKVKINKGKDSVVIEVENEKGEKETTIGCQIKKPK